MIRLDNGAIIKTYYSNALALYRPVAHLCGAHISVASECLHMIIRGKRLQLLIMIETQLRLMS